MAELRTRTSEGVLLRQELAGAGSRFGAGLIDLQLFVVSWILLAVLLRVLGELLPSGMTSMVMAITTMGAVLLWIGLTAVMHATLKGRSPGKMIFGLRVVGEEGQPVGIVALMLRSVLLLVDILPIPVPIGLLVMTVTPRRQRLGDLVAGTMVVHEPRRYAVSEPWPRETHENLQLKELGLTPALAARLDGEDLDYLREVVTRRGMGSEARDRLYKRVARHYTERLGCTQQVQPRVVLKELYIYLREQRQG